MWRKKILIFSVLATMCVTGRAEQGEDMRAEADAFLRSTPAAVQNSQRDAVLQAAAGDLSALQSIRASRKPSFTVSENVDTVTLEGGHILFIPRDGNRARRLLVYMHGGGWAFGSPASAARFCDSVASTGVSAVLDVNYPLSPETSEEQQAEWLRQFTDYVRGLAVDRRLDPARIFIGGDSAGGYMALLAALLSPDVFAGVIPIYPVITSEPSPDRSWHEYGSGYANNADIMEAFYRAWKSGNRRSGAAIPRLNSADDHELAALPPVFMIAAERDVLRDSGQAFAGRIMRAGGRIRRIELPGTVHLFITVPGQPTAFRKAVVLTEDFINNISPR